MVVSLESHGVHSMGLLLYILCGLNSMYHVQLLASKTRIASLKAHTISRLGLMASFETALEAEVEITEILY